MGDGEEDFGRKAFKRQNEERKAERERVRYMKIQGYC